MDNPDSAIHADQKATSWRRVQRSSDGRPSMQECVKVNTWAEIRTMISMDTDRRNNGKTKEVSGKIKEDTMKNIRVKITILCTTKWTLQKDRKKA